jgi:coiled-coil domain-containing protein 40
LTDGAEARMQMKETERQLARLAQDMLRLNTLIAKNQELAETLENDTFNLERDVACELRELEGKAAALERDIDAAAQAKTGTLDGVLDTERQIMLWERKIQLEKEMNDILDPSVGQARRPLLLC